MGVINHDVVLATTWRSIHFDRMWVWIQSLNEYEKPLFIRGDSKMNNYKTIILLPDGSKEGWEDSLKGDELREKFIHQIKKHAFEDKSSPWDWVWVSYGEYGQKVEEGNCTLGL